MPRKAHTLTDEERAKRIRETADEIGTSNDPNAFERAFDKIVPTKHPKANEPPKQRSAKRLRLSHKRD